MELVDMPGLGFGDHNVNSHFVILNFKPELKIWKKYNVVKLIILLILVSRIIV